MSACQSSQKNVAGYTAGTYSLASIMDNKDWQWFGGGFAAGVIIMGFIWIAMTSHTAKVAVSDTGTSTDSSIIASTSKRVTTPNNAVAVNETSTTASGETISTVDQSAGIIAYISSVTVMHTTWIAIKDTNGRILGAHRIETSGTNVAVNLLRAMVKGQTYQAVLYVDNGDKAFSSKTDTLVVGSERAPVASTFKAQ